MTLHPLEIGAGFVVTRTEVEDDLTDYDTFHAKAEEARQTILQAVHGKQWRARKVEVYSVHDPTTDSHLALTRARLFVEA